jgi:Fur family transcriptional regulator, peroxide stress response regulator
MKKTALLQRYNLKATPQRLEIVNVLSIHGHMSINELYSTLLVKFPSISLATIYKNINIMLEKGFLLEVKLSGQKNVFELIKDNHSHVACLKCTDIIDIDLNIEAILQEVKSISDYKIESNSLIFNGLCPKCSALN